MKKTGILMFFIAAALLIAPAFAAQTGRAAEGNFYSAVGITVGEAGYGNSLILFDNLIDQGEGDTYLYDTVLYRHGGGLPGAVNVHIEGLASGYTADLAVSGASRRFAGAPLAFTPLSATSEFSVTIRNSLGAVVHRLNVNAGFVTAADIFDGGDGTAADPFIVSTPRQLDDMRLFLSSNFRLSGDIDLAGYRCRANEYFDSDAQDGAWRAIGGSASYAFSGSLSGGASKFAVKNLQIENSAFFGYLNKAVIKDIGFKDFGVTALSSASAVIAKTAADTGFTNITLDGAFVNKAAGSAAVVCSATYSESYGGANAAQNVSVTLDTAGSSNAGVGGAFYSVSGYAGGPRASLSLVTVNAGLYGGGTYNGGVSARASDVIISGAVFNGSITLAAGSSQCGGIIGAASNVELSDCRADLDITQLNGASSYVGGIVGYSSTALNIEASAAGDVLNLGTGGNIGGLAGYVNGRLTVNGDSSSSFAQISGGADNVGGMAGYAAGLEIGAGVTAAVTSSVIKGGQYTGGLAGRINGAVSAGAAARIDVAVADRITGGNYTAGFIGAVSGAAGTADLGGNIFSYAKLVEGAQYTGGFIGFCEKPLSAGTADISAAAVRGTSYVGGVLGGNAAAASVSFGAASVFNIGSVSGTSVVGGFAGQIYTGGTTALVGQTRTINGGLKGITLAGVQISNTGSYTGGFAGDFYGYAEDVTVKANITAGNTFAGGFAGRFAGGADTVLLSVNLNAVSQCGGFAGQINALSGHPDALIDKVTLTGASILNTTGSYVGGLSGQMAGGAVSGFKAEKGIRFNCTPASYMAGGVGQISGGSITECDITVSLTGVSYFGGLAGHAANCHLGNDSKITANLNYTGSGAPYIGGFAANMTDGAVVGSHNEVKVNISAPAATNFIGGFIGETLYTTRPGSVGEYNKVSGKLITHASQSGGFIGRCYIDVGKGTYVDVELDAQNHALSESGLVIGSMYTGWLKSFAVSPGARFLNASGTLTYTGLIGLVSSGTVGGETGADEDVLKLSNNVTVTGGNPGGTLTGSIRNGTFKNIVISGTVTSSGSGPIGALAGMTESNYGGGYYENITVLSSATVISTGGGKAGGLIGEAGFKKSVDPRFKNCATFNTVTGGGTIGGFCGSISGAVIGDDCESHGDVVTYGGNYYGAGNLGGFAGSLTDVLVSSAGYPHGPKSYGNVYGPSTPGGSGVGSAGGFAGVIAGIDTDIKYCQSSGTVYAYMGHIGGFVGWMTVSTALSSYTAQGTVSYCKTNSELIYQQPSVRQSCYFGGFVGQMSGGTILAYTCEVNINRVYGPHAGGFAGMVFGGLLTGGPNDTDESTYMTISQEVIGLDGAGGVVYALGQYDRNGAAERGMVKNFKVTGTVTSKNQAYPLNFGGTGGAIGYACNGSAMNLIVETSATVTTAYGYSGGLFGLVYTRLATAAITLTNCTAKNNIYNNGYNSAYVGKVGGAIQFYNVALAAFPAGDVSGSNITITNCTSTGQINSSAGDMSLKIGTDTVATTVVGAVGGSVTITVTFTGGTGTAAALLLSDYMGMAQVAVTGGNVTVDFLRTGNIIVRFYNAADQTLYKDVAFKVAEPIPGGADFTADGYILGAWSGAAVTVTPVTLPASITDYFDTQIFAGGIWTAFDHAYAFNVSGVYELRLRYVEKDGQKPMPEFFAGLIMIETGAQPELVYNTFESGDGMGIYVTIGKAPALSGMTYQYKIDDGAYLDFTGTSVYVDYGKTLTISSRRGVDAEAGLTVINAAAPAAPTGRLEVYGYAAGTWAVSEITIYLAASTGFDGMNFAYCVDGGAETRLSQSFVKLSQNINGRTYTFRLYDKYRRLIDSKEILVRLDMSAPSLSSALPARTAMIDGSYNAALDITNAPVSGIKEIRLWDGAAYTAIDPGLLTYTLSRNGSHTIIMEDNAGRRFKYDFTVDFLKRGDINDFEVTGTPGEGEWAQSVTLDFFTTSENVSTVEYSRDNGLTWDTSPSLGGFTPAENGVYLFRATDFGGTAVMRTVTVRGIDATAPFLGVEYDTHTYNKGGRNALLTVITGSSGVRSLTYTIDGGAVNDITGQDTLAIFERGTYRFTLTNNAGASVTRTINVTLIDSSETLTLKVTADGSRINVWTKDPLTFDLSVQEELISPVKYYYSVNGGGWTLLSGASLTVSGNVNAIYTFKAETLSGLVSVSGGYSVKLDSEAPAVVVGSEWNTAARKVTFTIGSANTVCAYTGWYRAVGGTDWLAMPGMSVTLDIPGAGADYYEFMIRTELGLTGVSAHYAVTLDTNKPVLNLTLSEGSYNMWQAGVKFTLTNSTLQPSGTLFQYSRNGTDGWTNIPSVFAVTFTHQGTLYFRAVSGTGQVSDIVESGLVMVDRKADAVITDAGSGLTKDDVSLTVRFENGGSGFKTVYIVLPSGIVMTVSGQGTIPLTAKENGDYRFYVTNKAGVENIIVYSVTRIDKATPGFTVAAAGRLGEWTNEPVAVTLTPTAMPVSGMRFQYTADGTNWENIGGLTTSLSEVTYTIRLQGNNTFQFRAVSGTGVIINDTKQFNVMLDSAAPALSVTRSADTGDKVRFDVSADFSGSGGSIFVSHDGADTKITGSYYEIPADGIYSFYAESATGVKSAGVTKVVTSPKYSGVTGGEKYSRNVSVFAQNYEKIVVYKDLKEIDAKFVNGSSGFSENGSYKIEFYGESGNVISVSFIISKPNYALYGGITGAALLAIALIAFFAINYVRKSRALNRLIAASSVSDDPNNFVMLNRIK